MPRFPDESALPPKMGAAVLPLRDELTRLDRERATTSAAIVKAKERLAKAKADDLAALAAAIRSGKDRPKGTAIREAEAKLADLERTQGALNLAAADAIHELEDLIEKRRSEFLGELQEALASDHAVAMEAFGSALAAVDALTARRFVKSWVRNPKVRKSPQAVAPRIAAGDGSPTGAIADMTRNLILGLERLAPTSDERPGGPDR
jgi:hypothetical protein